LLENVWKRNFLAAAAKICETLKGAHMTSILGRSFALTDPFSDSSHFNSTHAFQDGLLWTAVQEASNWKAFAAMTIGGGAYKIAKYSILSKAPFLGGVLSSGLALGAEVNAYRASLQLFEGRGLSASSLFHFKEWMSDFVNFGALKSVAALAITPNSVLGHLFQDIAMVAGHQMAYGLDLAARPEGSLLQQMIHAEVVNCQMLGGMSLVHQLSGKHLRMREAALELQIRSLEPTPPRPALRIEDLTRRPGPLGIFGLEGTDAEPDAMGYGGLELRDYQQAYKAAILASMEAGEDRRVLKGPTQVGKTWMLGPLSLEARQKHFPGKKTLVISPFKILTSQILGDLTAYPGKLGIIDAKYKDFEGDHEIVVASAMTLVRHLSKLNPEDYGLVVVDEAIFVHATSWKKILSHLGFLDAEGMRQPAPGKYLLGVTADPYSLSEVFGDQPPVAHQGLSWFMEKGYLHKVKGMRARFAESIGVEVIEEGGESIIAPARSKATDEAIVDSYDELLAGSKTLVFTATIDRADSVVEAFTRRHGEGYAAAVHVGKGEKEIGDALQGYKDGSGPKVLVSIGMLSYGVRASGTEGVIMAYETNSLRRYGQRVGRALGMVQGEAQREVLVVDFQGRNKKVVGTACLPRLFGVPGYDEGGLPFEPMAKIPRRLASQRGVPKPVTGGTRGLFRFEYVPEEEKIVRAHLLPDRLNEFLERRFNSDIEAMAQALSMDLDELDHYLFGEIPRHAGIVRDIEEALKLPPLSLVAYWEKDALAILEGVYPYHEETGPRAKEFIELFRRAVLRKGRGSIRSAMTDDDAYRRSGLMRELLYGRMVQKSAALRMAYDLILDSGIAEPSDIRRLMSAAVLENAGSSPIATRDDFDPRYQDAFDFEVVPVGAVEEGYELVYRTVALEEDPLDAETAWGEAQLNHRMLEGLRKAMTRLGSREALVLNGRYGIGEEDGQSLTAPEISEKHSLNISHTRIGHLEAKGEQDLRTMRKDIIPDANIVYGEMDPGAWKASYYRKTRFPFAQLSAKQGAELGKIFGIEATFRPLHQLRMEWALKTYKKQKPQATIPPLSSFQLALWVDLKAGDTENIRKAGFFAERSFQTNGDGLPAFLEWLQERYPNREYFFR